MCIQKKRKDLNLRVPNMRLHELAATCRCPLHLLIHVGQEEIPRLVSTHLLLLYEAVMKIVRKCNLISSFSQINKSV